MKPDAADWIARVVLLLNEIPEERAERFGCVCQRGPCESCEAGTHLNCPERGGSLGGRPVPDTSVRSGPPGTRWHGYVLDRWEVVVWRVGPACQYRCPCEPCRVRGRALKWPRWFKVVNRPGNPLPRVAPRMHTGVPCGEQQSLFDIPALIGA